MICGQKVVAAGGSLLAEFLADVTCFMDFYSKLAKLKTESTTSTNRVETFPPWMGSCG